MGIILMYSVMDRDSFLSISQWMEDLSEHGPNNNLIILASNKNDCSNTERQVSSR
jgi:GTPase SAR1 family protein